MSETVKPTVSFALPVTAAVVSAPAAASTTGFSFGGGGGGGGGGSGSNEADSAFDYLRLWASEGARKGCKGS